MDDVTKKMDASQPVCLPFIHSTGQKVEIEILFAPIFFPSPPSSSSANLLGGIFMAWHEWLTLQCLAYERTQQSLLCKYSILMFHFAHPSIDLLLKLIKMYEMLFELLAIDSIQIVCMKFCRIWRNQCFISRKTILFYNINFPGSIHIFFSPSLCVSLPTLKMVEWNERYERTTTTPKPTKTMNSTGSRSNSENKRYRCQKPGHSERKKNFSQHK